MIEKNADARDYYFDVHVDPVAMPNGSVCSWRFRNCWGMDYDHGIDPALWHGFTLDVTYEAAPAGGGAGAWTVEFESAFDDPNYTASGTTLNSWWFRVYLDNARLVGRCGKAKLTFDELRLTRRSSVGGAETLLYTITGPITYVNASYDPTKDWDFIQPTASVAYPSPGAASCPATPGADGGTDQTVTAGMEFAWEYGVPGSGIWGEDTVEVDNTDDLYGTSSCVATVGDITLDPPPLNTKWIILSASINDQYSSPFILTQTFTCPGSTTPITVAWYDVKRELEFHEISAYIHRKDGLMTQRVINTQEINDANGSVTTTTTSVTVTDGYTVIRKNTSDYRGVWHTLCDYETSTRPYDPCTPPDGYEPDVPEPDPASYPYCTSSIVITQTWVSPTCVNPGGLHMTRRLHEGFMYAVQTLGTDILLWCFDFTLDKDTVTTVQEYLSDLGSSQIANAPKSRLLVVYEQAGSVKITESFSSGNNNGWSTPVTVATGTYPACAIDERYNHEYIAVYDAGTWKLYRKLNEESSFTYIADIASTATEESAGLELCPSASGSLVFVYNDAGTTKRKYSSSQGLVWNNL